MSLLVLVRQVLEKTSLHVYIKVLYPFTVTNHLSLLPNLLDHSLISGDQVSSIKHHPALLHVFSDDFVSELFIKFIIICNAKWAIMSKLVIDFLKVFQL